MTLRSLLRTQRPTPLVLVAAIFFGLLFVPGLEAAPVSGPANPALLAQERDRLTWERISGWFSTRERLIQIGGVALVLGLFLLFRARSDIS
jgi:hypothetical protein